MLRAAVSVIPDLALEGDPGSSSRRAAFTRGKPPFFHISTASSLRSIARRACCYCQLCLFGSPLNSRLINVFIQVSVHPC